MCIKLQIKGMSMELQEKASVLRKRSNILNKWFCLEHCDESFPRGRWSLGVANHVREVLLAAVCGPAPHSPLQMGEQRPPSPMILTRVQSAYSR